MKVMSNWLDKMMDEETATGALKKLQESMKSKSGGSSVYYRYKRMDYGQSCTLRFLPSSAELAENEVQPSFWLERKVIRLRFDDPAQEGGVVILPIPVMQMYKGGKADDDIILRQVTPLYDEADKLKKAGEQEKSDQVRAKASYHWHRGEAIAQCFVPRSPFVEQDLPENPIRLVELNKQLRTVISNTLNSDDPEVKLEAWPCHGKKGTNFVIKKTKSGDWPAYNSGSCFSRHVTPWTQEQIAALEKFGLFNLETFLPARPGDDEYKFLAHIVERSIAGMRTWDADWEAHLKAVKVYRANADGSRAETEGELQAQITETVAKLNTTASTSASDVMAKLSRNTREDEASSEAVGETETVDESEVDVTPDDRKTAGDVQSIVNKIKNRTAGKTASAD